MRPVIWASNGHTGTRWSSVMTQRLTLGFVCPKEVKKLVQRARSMYWKKWTAKHEHEELKEGAWLEPGLLSCERK